MKKIVCLFGVLALLASCSNEDSPSDSPQQILLKRQVITRSDGKVTIDYKYEENRIVSVTDNSGELNLFYTYTGDQITQIDFKLPNGTVQQVNTFMYRNDGKLEAFLRVQSETVNGFIVKTGYKEVYTYNADNTISVQSYRGNDSSQELNAGEFTITFDNQNVVDISGAYIPNHKYVYDNKNNFAKNILGMDKIAFVDSEVNGVFHNEISSVIGGEIASIHSYTYNGLGYPQRSVDQESGEKYSSEYFY